MSRRIDVDHVRVAEHEKEKRFKIVTNNAEEKIVSFTHRFEMKDENNLRETQESS